MSEEDGLGRLFHEFVWTPLDRHLNESLWRTLDNRSKPSTLTLIFDHTVIQIVAPLIEDTLCVNGVHRVPKTRVVNDFGKTFSKYSLSCF